ncbi:ParB/RepB/Spo0J family partition protein [Pseudooceanicola sediminis]|uniref:ParB/RepB/Spo0J family partition protein n=1 Tax=Pseudooceanicola sediminis TaxID=2211117 RepID=A0A399J2Y2_9RHOB|nr:ParB/RepB/Spo0J family partition protein [Pseudooceanicola sediminis]KAA2314936.1 ParB/RepB/Spo0J family partition protein [Puniceibacterium sp. HSS470]RII37306.1 ParB/RepB/Spo0J family partition protein [Pseudooceanicola sediminis]|tara:strand:- start:19811 stop:20800 length:990 start_codon:yes stop_codon:yes gene_type:complete
MSKRHDAVFDDVLAGLGETDKPGRDRSGTRFLKRSTTMAEQVAGERQEKVLRLVDPDSCVMWAGHNRAYDLLTPQNCRDLIDGILSQGKQEFPAIVRRLRPAQDGQGPEFEVICGARRHFAVSWLRANNYPQFRYLVEERVMTDEEAFRLADIENRDREDISDLERARDYAKAVEAYYQGKQNLMAERLQVSAGWLSRYLQLAKLDDRIVSAFASLRDVKELHARQLKPLMASEQGRAAILQEADRICAEQKLAEVPVAKVLSRLKSAATPPKQRNVADKVYRQNEGQAAVQMRSRGNRIQLEFDKGLDDDALRRALEQFIADRKTGKS